MSEGWDRVARLRQGCDARMGLDGLVRPESKEDELNRLCASVFSQENGEALLTYLRSITIERIGGPGIDDCALRHLEGQRYLVGILEQRIALGRKES